VFPDFSAKKESSCEKWPKTQRNAVNTMAAFAELEKRERAKAKAPATAILQRMQAQARA